MIEFNKFQDNEKNLEEKLLPQVISSLLFFHIVGRKI